MVNSGVRHHQSHYQVCTVAAAGDGEQGLPLCDCHSSWTVEGRERQRDRDRDRESYCRSGNFHCYQYKIFVVSASYKN